MLSFFPVENIQGTGGSPVSWEHFFHSLMLYHEHLRKDLPSADSVQYRHLPSRGITQKEQDGLIAFLQLTSTIITWVSITHSTYFLPRGHLRSSQIFVKCLKFISDEFCTQNSGFKLCVSLPSEGVTVALLIVAIS